MSLSLDSVVRSYSLLKMRLQPNQPKVRSILSIEFWRVDNLPYDHLIFGIQRGTDLQYFSYAAPNFCFNVGSSYKMTNR
jgi:hypothetical protein